MKNAYSLTKTQMGSDFPFDLAAVRGAVVRALEAVEDARQKCIAAGQMLLEAKARTEHGDFLELLERAIPEISRRTATTWMRAAANVLKALPQPAIDVAAEAIPVSEILATPDDELPAAARDWKQQWFAFTSGKTIKECLSGVFVDGDEAHRVDRAINGRTKGGAGGDRKDFPLFAAVKLQNLGTHLSHWKGMTQTQRSELEQVFRAAASGDPMRLRGRSFVFAAWPVEITELVIEALRARVKGGKS